MHGRNGIPRTWSRSAVLAAISGARTMMGPVFAARVCDRWGRARPWIVRFAVGELLVDKVPGIPDRTAAAPLLGRAVAGSAVVLASRPTRGARGALMAVALGATAAVAGALLTFQLRRRLGRWLGGRAMANLVSGAIEDGLVLAAGHYSTRRSSI